MRLHTVLALTALVAVTFAPIGARAAGEVEGRSLSVRLLRAGNGDGGTADPRLQDILPVLKSSLRFQSYEYVSEATGAIRAGATISVGEGLSLQIADVQGSGLGVTVTGGHDGRTKLLRTRLNLAPAKPVILGGFPDGTGGNLILVLMLR